MAILAANTGSTFTSNACVVGSKNSWAWLGFMTGSATGVSAACCAWYQTTASTSGCEILSLKLAPCQVWMSPIPIESSCGLYVSLCGTSGSAVVWMRLRAYSA